jgi:hypothetical protein
LENEDLKGFFKANFRFRCVWKFIRIEEISQATTTLRPENSAPLNDFQKWDILENSPILENITEHEITTNKNGVKLTTEKREINSTDQKWDILENSAKDKISVENISETQIDVQVTTKKAEEKINSTEKINLTEEPGEKTHATEQVSQLNHVQLTTEKAEIKKNEYEDEESEGEQSEDEESQKVNYQTTNYVDLPKFTTENNDNEVKNYFIVTIVTVALLLFFIGTMIVLIIFCKKKSDKKVTNFPMQSLGE